MNNRSNLTAIALTAACLVALVSPAVAGSYDKPAADIVDTAVGAGNFTTLVAAVQAAGLVDALKADGPLTVFAPTDAAFAKLPKGTVESLLLPENKDKLVAILTYHVLAGKVMSKDVKPGSVAMLQGSKATLSASGSNLMIDNATIVSADIVTSNGVIHVIDEVILPN